MEAVFISATISNREGVERGGAEGGEGADRGGRLSEDIKPGEAKGREERERERAQRKNKESIEERERIEIIPSRRSRERRRI